MTERLCAGQYHRCCLLHLCIEQPWGIHALKRAELMLPLFWQRTRAVPRAIYAIAVVPSMRCDASVAIFIKHILRIQLSNDSVATML